MADTVYSGDLPDLTFVGFINGPTGFSRYDASTVLLEGELLSENPTNADEFLHISWLTSLNTCTISTLGVNAGTARNLAIDAGASLYLSGTSELLLEGLKWPRTAGNAGEVLSSDGVDQLSWIAAAGGGDFVDVDGHSAIGAEAEIDSGLPLYPVDTYSNLLSVGETIVDLSTAYAVGLACLVELNPSIAPVATTYGADIEIKTAAGNAQNFDNITGGYMAAVHDGDGTVDWLVGSDSTALVNSGDCTKAYGSYVAATGGGDTYGLYSYAAKNNAQPSAVGTLAGGYFTANNTLASAAGTDTTYGVYAALNRTGATGGTINSYGYYLDIQTLDGAGAGTHNAYGMYLEDVAGADNNYAIYSAGGDSHFEGSVKTTNIIAPKSVCMASFASDAAVVDGSGTVAFSVPADLNGYALSDVTCTVTDKGITGETKVQVRRRSGGVDADMLTTPVSLGDEFWATDGTVNPANADVLTGDQIYIDITEVHSGTAPNGLSTVLTFRKG